MTAALWQPALERFPSIGNVNAVAPLASAGFSGALLWKVSAAAGDFALRRWPQEHPSSERLEFIHSFQRHLRFQGALAFIPAPVLSSDGRSFAELDGHFWELATWMPGAADFHHQPTDARLTAAMTALARIHCAAAQMPGKSQVGASPGLAARNEHLSQLMAGGIHLLRSAIGSRPLPWDDLAQQICRHFDRVAPQVQSQLAASVAIRGPLCPCLRDIWHDHVLFTGDDVTGVIDFGAAQVESPAGDIVRLVGSLVGDDVNRWRAALTAYESLRPLSESERGLIGAFDASGVLLSGINWLTWLYAEGREFPCAAEVTRRMEHIVSRLASCPLLAPARY